MYSVKPWSSDKGLIGELTPPADKSISHRALIFAALAEGQSRVSNLLQGEDVLRTRAILEQLGVTMKDEGETLVVEGQEWTDGRPAFFKDPRDMLYCGNSGTTMRLMMGLLAAQPFESRLTGDASLNRRPMQRVMAPLRQMGAEFAEEQGPDGRVIVVKGNPKLKAIDYQSPVASAQVKSAVLLAGLYADGTTRVVEPHLSRDHTKKFLAGLGVKVGLQQGGRSVALHPGRALEAFELTVPADPSSAAFFVVAALLVPRSSLIIKNICLNPTRIGFLNVLERMGARIRTRDESVFGRGGGEPVGTLEIESSELQATEILPEEVPWLIDEIPILAVAMARAKGTSRITGAGELRVKESDRLTQIAKLLSVLGVPHREEKEGIEITGAMSWKGGTVGSHGDHRIAMSAAVAGLLCRDGMTVTDTACVATSFPGFREELQRLGVQISPSPLEGEGARRADEGCV